MLTALIDSGSSVSLVPNYMFNDIKYQTKVRYLSRQVQIKTVNSNLKFFACAEISFKIDGHFFKQPFYIANFRQQSFDCILGYDFIMKTNLLIDSKNLCVKFDDFTVSLLARSNDNTSNFVDKVNPLNVKLMNKCIIPPGELTQVNVKITNQVNDNMEVLFQPKVFSANIECFPSLHIVKNNQFSTIIKYISTKSVHLNKSQNIGTVSPNPEIVNDDKNVNKQPDSDFNAFCNLFRQILRIYCHENKI